MARYPTRPMVRAVGALTLVVLIALVTACASGGRGSADAIPIRVRNNLVPSLNVQISALSDASVAPVRLGSLVSGAEQTFHFRPAVVTSTFRLVASLPGPGRSLVSEPIPFPREPGTSIEWELSNNNVVVRAQ